MSEQEGACCGLILSFGVAFLVFSLIMVVCVLLLTIGG